MDVEREVSWVSGAQKERVCVLLPTCGVGGQNNQQRTRSTRRHAPGQPPRTEQGMPSWPGPRLSLCAPCGQAALWAGPPQLPLPPACTALKPPGRPAARPGCRSPTSWASSSRSQATSPGACASPSSLSSPSKALAPSSEDGPNGLRTACRATTSPRPSDEPGAVAPLLWRGPALALSWRLPPRSRALNRASSRTQPPAAPATRAWSGTPCRKGRSAASLAPRLLRPAAAGEAGAGGGCGTA